MPKAEDINQGGNVIRFRPTKATKASERKWTKPVMDVGFCIVPSLLLKAQARLGLSPTQLAVLMHLVEYWWDVDRKPYPSKKTLAERLRLSARQVQRHIADLEDMGYVRRVERRAPHRGKLTNEYDLSGLVTRLNELAPEFLELEEEIRTRRRAVTQPRLRRRPSAPG